MDIQIKICTKCKLPKDLSEFWNSKSGKKGKNPRCVLCCKQYTQSNHHKTWAKDYYKRKQQNNVKFLRETHVRLRYKLSPEDYKERLAQCDNKCEICKNILTEPHVDHDHLCCPGNRSCGKCVRGILCKKCNAGLGMYRDDIAILKASVRYLEKYAIKTIPETVA